MAPTHHKLTRLAAALLALPLTGQAAVNFSSSYSQNFDTLAASGTNNAWTNDTTLPGWSLFKQPAPGTAITAYNADNGGSNAGTFYSYGSTGASDRALGGLGSGGAYFGSPAAGAVAGWIAFSATNTSGATIDTLNLAYDGEQWRNGGNATAQTMVLEYGFGATFSAVSTWTAAGSAFNFTSPVATASAAAVDGNNAGRSARTGSLTGLNWTNGTTLWLRWIENNDAGNDHGLALDNFSLSTTGAAPSLSINDVSKTEGDSGTTTFTFTVSLSAPAGAGGVSFDIATADGTATAPGDYTAQALTGQSIPQGSTSHTFTVAVNGDTTVESNETFFVNVTNLTGADVADAQGQGTINNDDIATTPIHDVQGSASTSPLLGQTVTVSGIVTADLQASNQLSGFFLQEPEGNDDGDPATSEGIFVFCSSCATPVNVGDRVQVTGTVQEFNGLTEIGSVSAVGVVSTGNALPAISSITLPEPTDGELERYEGMYVDLPDMTVQQNYFLGRYGQLTLGYGGRLRQPTNIYDAGSIDAQNLADLNARSLVVLDDGSSSQNPNPTPYIGQDDTVRAGDTVANLVGVLDFGPINSDTSVRDYRLHPTSAPVFTRANARATAPDPVGGNLKVASANVLNYFTTLDESGSPGCYPGGTRADCRGADSLDELDRQADKLVRELAALDADVVGLMEIENNGPTAVGDLVSRLNALVGSGSYTYVQDPIEYQNHSANGTTDAIKVAMIYKPGKVTPVGSAQALDSAAFSIGRAPMAQTFQANANDARFTVVVNHFKSKSSCPASGPDIDQGDGQGCFNATRVAQAQALLGFIADLKATSGDDDVLVIGDLNAYGQEDPVQTLVGGGLIDQLAARIAHPYSYVFDGLAGYLDHALTTASLGTQVAGVTEWHNNADEPSFIDYNLEFKQPACAACEPDLYTQAPYRASDHDPVLIGFNLARSAFAGNSSNNALTGTAGGDQLTGNGGKDTLTGLGGKDWFVYNSVTDGIDTITDFTPGTDQIVLTQLLQSLHIGSANPIVAGHVVCAAQGADSSLAIDPDAGGPAAKRVLAIVKSVGCGSLLQTLNFTF